jgi:hypothetical protein
MKTANIVELRLRRNSRPEQRRAARDVFAFHLANGGYRRSIETAILKGLGVVAEGLDRALTLLEGWGILKSARHDRTHRLQLARRSRHPHQGGARVIEVWERIRAAKSRRPCDD